MQPLPVLWYLHETFRGTSFSTTPRELQHFRRLYSPEPKISVPVTYLHIVYWIPPCFSFFVLFLLPWFGFHTQIPILLELLNSILALIFLNFVCNYWSRTLNTLSTVKVKPTLIYPTFSKLPICCDLQQSSQLIYTVVSNLYRGLKLPNSFVLSLEVLVSH